MARLARVTDPRALDADEGARATLSIAVPASWLHEGATLEITVPRKLTCARCDGGGCDACGRSGALAAPDAAAARRVSLTLPARSAANLRIRLVDPLDGGIAQLLVDVRTGDPPSGVRRIVVAPPPVRLPWRFVAVALALVAAVLAAVLAAMSC